MIETERMVEILEEDRRIVDPVRHTRIWPSTITIGTYERHYIQRIKK